MSQDRKEVRIDMHEPNQERTDGLTPRQEVSLTRRVAKTAMKLGRWDTEKVMSNGKTIMQGCADLVEEVLGDDRNSPSTKMFAADLALKMHQQNIVMARMDAEGDGEGESEGRVIVILPPNGSEVKG